MKTYQIYKLVEEQRTETWIDLDIVRWVGITTLPLKERLSQHLRDKSNKKKWVQGLKKQGKKPIIKLIVKLEFDDNSLYDQDRYFIERYYIKKHTAMVFNIQSVIQKYLHTAYSHTKTSGNDKKV